MGKEIQKTTDTNPIKGALENILSNLDNISDYEITRKNNKTTIKVDSKDKTERKIFSYEEQGSSYNSTTITNTKQMSIEERRELVKKLDSEGMSQSEIASKTMRSQKTISNDLKAIKS